jgi:hypothetical protein
VIGLPRLVHASSPESEFLIRVPKPARLQAKFGIKRLFDIEQLFKIGNQQDFFHIRGTINNMNLGLLTTGIIAQE